MVVQRFLAEDHVQKYGKGVIVSDDLEQIVAISLKLLNEGGRNF